MSAPPEHVDIIEGQLSTSKNPVAIRVMVIRHVLSRTCCSVDHRGTEGNHERPAEGCVAPPPVLTPMSPNHVGRGTATTGGAGCGGGGKSIYFYCRTCPVPPVGCT